jgi:predicted nucleic acid-binding protein
MIATGDARRRIVVDASVAAKWLIREYDSDRAVELLSGACELHVPDLCIAEIGNMLWKRVRRGDITSEHAMKAVLVASELPAEIHPHSSLVARAFHIAQDTNLTVYDALYVALAESLETELITADNRLAAAGTGREAWPVRLL